MIVMPVAISQTAKFWVGAVAAVATSLLTVLSPDTDAYKVVTIVVAVAGALGVYLVPNATAVDLSDVDLEGDDEDPADDLADVPGEHKA